MYLLSSITEMTAPDSSSANIPWEKKIEENHQITTRTRSQQREIPQIGNNLFIICVPRRWDFKTTVIKRPIWLQNNQTTTAPLSPTTASNEQYNSQLKPTKQTQPINLQNNRKMSDNPDNQQEASRAGGEGEESDMDVLDVHPCAKVMALF